MFITHPVSIAGSCYIVQSIAARPSQRVQMRNKIMIAISTCDVLFSGMTLVGLVAAPRGESMYLRGVSSSRFCHDVV